MFIEDEPLLVLPVAMAPALEWVRGKLSDVDLLLRAPLRPEGVFVVNMPNRAAWRPMLQQIAVYRAQGASFAICRSNNPIIARKVYGRGQAHGLLTYCEGLKYRFLSPPAAFGPWIDAVTLRRDGSMMEVNPAQSPKTP